MRLINNNVKNHLKASTYCSATMIEMGEPVTFRATDFDLSIFRREGADTFEYVPVGMKLGAVRTGSGFVVDSFSISLDDTNRSLVAELNNFAGFEDVKFRMYLGVLYSATFKLIDRMLVYSGIVDKWTYRPGSMEMVIVSAFSQWNKRPSNMFSGSCRWKVFKGADCKYTGYQGKCDRSFKQCEEYGNSKNFGGFRWLPFIDGKTLKIGMTDDEARQL